MGQFSVTIYGATGSVLSDIQQTEARAAVLSHHLLFLPVIQFWDMARFHQALDTYIAHQRRDGFGLTPLNAMANDVPTIATRAGAFGEIIKDGQTAN